VFLGSHIESLVALGAGRLLCTLDQPFRCEQYGKFSGWYRDTWAVEMVVVDGDMCSSLVR
jgi:hypothetical protein